MGLRGVTRDAYTRECDMATLVILIVKLIQGFIHGIGGEDLEGLIALILPIGIVVGIIVGIISKSFGQNEKGSKKEISKTPSTGENVGPESWKCKSCHRDLYSPRELGAGYCWQCRKLENIG